jgi:hypothetical protein
LRDASPGALLATDRGVPTPLVVLAISLCLCGCLEPPPSAPLARRGPVDGGARVDEGDDLDDVGDPDAPDGADSDAPSSEDPDDPVLEEPPPDLRQPDPPPCDAPDVLVVLDRTASMQRTPTGAVPPNTNAGRAQSKWALAISALHELAAPPTDLTVRLGVVLFPRNPGDGSCPTLPTLLSGVRPTNPWCQAGEVLLPPALGTGTALTTSLTRDQTPLCISTPITAGLDAAATELLRTARPGHAQHIVLITDGRENCGGDPAGAAARAAQLGVHTYVLAFGVDPFGVSVPVLNAMACAGRTAVDFATRCVLSGTRFVPVDATGPALYRDAADGAALLAQLRSVAGQVCCGCDF